MRPTGLDGGGADMAAAEAAAGSAGPGTGPEARGGPLPPPTAAPAAPAGPFEHVHPPAEAAPAAARQRRGGLRGGA